MTEIQVKPSSGWYHLVLRKFFGTGVQKLDEGRVAVAFETEQGINLDVTMTRDAAEHLKAELEKALA